MPVDPTHIICEILGEPSDKMRNPANQDYQCPYLDGQCNKRSQQVSESYPICSVFLNATTQTPVCVCPVRFNEINLVEDILTHCWPSPKPLIANLRVINEIKFGDLGKMDMVLAAVDGSGVIKKFVSVELQAIDITGSYFSAYTALTNSEMLAKRPTYGFNWQNVYKRYITQLINKGFQHYSWGTIIVSVMQDIVLERMIEIGHIISAPLENSNVIFLGYKFAWNDDNARYEMTLNKIIGTTHANIVQGHLMRQSIPIGDILEKLQARL